MTDKFYFSMKSFLDLKEIVEIIEGKDLYMGYPEILTLEFTGAVLKVYVRYYTIPYTKVIYTIKTDKDETQKLRHLDLDNSENSDKDETQSPWVVECPFTNIKEFFLDESTRNILDDVGVMSDEDSDSDEETPLFEFMGSVYLCYTANEESQSVLAPRVRRGILVFQISNTKDTIHKSRIVVNIREVT